MNKKTIFYITLSISIVSFYLYLQGYRLQAKSIYKDRALAYMSETYEVIVESDDYAIVEFEGVTEIIPFQNSKRTNNSWFPSLESFLIIEKYSYLPITYPVHKIQLTNNYRTVFQIFKNEGYQLRVLSFTFNESFEYGSNFEEKIGYVYVDNNSNEVIDFQIWNPKDDTYTPLIYTTKPLKSGASLIYSNQIVDNQSKLIPFINGSVFDEYSHKPTIQNAKYNGMDLDQTMFQYLEKIYSIPSSYEPDLNEGQLEDFDPILTIDETVLYMDGTSGNDTTNFYEYMSKTYMEHSGVYYIISTSQFNDIISQIKPTL